jgi:hypothetical protein
MNRMPNSDLPWVSVAELERWRPIYLWDCLAIAKRRRLKVLKENDSKANSETSMRLQSVKGK